MQINNNHIQGLDGSSIRVAVILPYFNDLLGNELYDNVEKELLKLKVPEKNITLVRVPGALETPLTAKKLALSKNHDVIIALGIIIRGETPHFEYVAQESIHGCMQVQLETMTPIISGILAVENEEQAKDRVSVDKLNKGKEFAQTAIFMARRSD